MNDTIPIPGWLSPFVLVAMWAFVTLALAHFGGWAALAESYRGALGGVERSEWMASGAFNRFGLPASYGNCLNVAVGPEGVQLSVFPLFALGAPRLLIPWRDVGRCRSWRMLGIADRFAFSPLGSGVKITLHGRAARVVRNALARHGSRPRAA